MKAREKEKEEDMNATMTMQGEGTTVAVVGLAEEVVEVAVVVVVVEVVLGTNRPSEADLQAVDQESQTSGARKWQQQTKKSGKRNQSLPRRTRKNPTLDSRDL
jgi:hypothetical protein